MVLMRRPFEMALLLVAVNGALLLYRELDLPFFALVFALLAIGSVAFISAPAIIRFSSRYLFRSNCPRGGPEEPNRIRDPNELLAILREPVFFVGWIVQIIRALAADDSREGQFIWTGALAGMCLLTAAVDWFPIVVIVIDGALLFPAIWFNSHVIAWRVKLFGKPKEKDRAVEDGPVARM
jgi:hypothetical protein